MTFVEANCHFDFESFWSSIGVGVTSCCRVRVVCPWFQRIERGERRVHCPPNLVCGQDHETSLRSMCFQSNSCQSISINLRLIVDSNQNPSRLVPLRMTFSRRAFLSSRNPFQFNFTLSRTPKNNSGRKASTLNESVAIGDPLISHDNNPTPFTSPKNGTPGQRGGPYLFKGKKREALPPSIYYKRRRRSFTINIEQGPKRDLL